MIAKTLVSEEEDFLLESEAEYKSEYHDGEIINMAGGTIQHNRIVNHLIGLLFECLKKKGVKCSIIYVGTFERMSQICLS